MEDSVASALPITDRPRALADIQLNTILAADQGASSEDEVPDARGIPADDARTAIGISIGQQQTRLTSPATPAIEKQAILQEAGGFFGGSLDGIQEPIAEEPLAEEGAGDATTDEGSRAGAARENVSVRVAGQYDMPQQSQPSSPVRMPSPWRAPSEPRRKKSMLRDGLMFHRRQGSAGPETMLESWQRTLMSSLPSLPKNISFPSPFSSNQDSANDAASAALTNPKRGSVQWAPSFGSNDRPQSRLVRQRSESDSAANHLSRTVTSREEVEAKATLGDLPSRPGLQHIRTRPAQLRRSASDTSLITHRTLSRVSSLGDDSRFEDVREQVNSRLKAIKDTWQESNIKLPSFSSLSSFAPEFMRDRSGSIGRKDSQTEQKPVDPLTRQPYPSARAAIVDAGASKATSHPHLNSALGQLDDDVVVLGGYRGSILRSADPPHRQLWVPVKVGLNLRKADLEVGITEEDDHKPSDKIIPGGMLTHIGPIDIARRLLKRLRTCNNAREGRLRVHEYGYDWRLSPTFLSEQFIAFLESLPCNQPGVSKERKGATIIAHSLGGLITRHAVNKRPELFRGVVYAGVPTTCVNILGPLRNGDEVLLSSRVLTAQVNFTIRTSFVLLPLDGRCFLDRYTKEEYPVDFFDPKTWIDCRLSPCLARPLPPLTAPEKANGISSYINSITNALPSCSVTGRVPNATGPKDVSEVAAKATTAAGVPEPDTLGGGSARTLANGNVDTSGVGRNPDADITNSIRTTVTIPREEAIAYLTRTLATVKKFKEELAFEPAHAAGNRYPPMAVIYGKSTPTVYGARVDGREGIKHADAYDELAFASGDGVVLARAAMVPEGYTTTRDGIISSERGHVTLLGDLEAVGKCVNAVIAGRKRGVGYGS